MHKFKFVFIFALLFIFASCGDDEIDCSDPDGLASELNLEIDKVNNAGQIYSNDPQNSSKCNDYKDALNSLIDYAETLNECPELKTAILQTNIDQAKTNIASLICN